MYSADGYPTQELTLHRPGRSRHWMVMGGAAAVTSVDFPELASANGMQLRVVTLKQAVSELVSYPKCTELGIAP